MTARSDTGPRRAARGLATWLIPPARDWQRKSGGIAHSRLAWPLLGLGAVLLALTGLTAWSASGPSGTLIPALEAGLALLGLTLVVATALLIRHDLLIPLTHLRNWALRVRGGNLAARIPQPTHGEFAELARDINNLGESLESLSRDMAAQVSKQTMRIEQKTRSLAILYDVAASINAARDLNDLLTRFLHTLCDLLNARGGVIRLIGEDGQMPLVASTGLDDDLVAQEHFVPSPQCLCSQAAQNGTPLCQDDLHHCAEVIGREFFERDDLGLVAIPLQYRGHTLGVYNLFVGSRDLSERDDLQPLLTSVGRHLGMAIEKTRLDEESKRLSLIEERTRLAHELHDSLAQTLASLRFQVKVLDETLPNDDYPSDEVKRIAGSLDEAHTELRELIAHFRAPVHERGFVPAIEELLERFRNQSGIRVFLQNEWPTAALSPDTATEVLRIIQEALCNVRKHARAHTVRVLLSHDAHRNRHILVEDDGVGMTVPTASNGGDHIGLSIMDERAQRIGARLRIESEPDEGTRLSLTLTCQDEPASLLAARRAAQ